MKNSPGCVRSVGGLRPANGFVLLLAVLTFSAGCGQKNDQAAAPLQQTNSASAPQATNNALATNDPDLTTLDRALRRWLMANRRPPKNFDDFAATAGVPIPPPPAGKKYIIAANMHIQLVDAK